MSNERRVITMSQSGDVYQEVVNLRGEVKVLQDKTTSIEKQLDVAEDNKLILRELQVIVKEFAEWRKASEEKLQQQNTTQVKITMVLDQLTAETKNHGEQLDTVKASINEMNTKGSISFNEIFRKIFFYLLTSAIGLIIGILGWAPHK